MKRRALLRGLTAAALVATPAMRAAALVRDFGLPDYGHWYLYQTTPFVVARKEFTYKMTLAFNLDLPWEEQAEAAEKIFTRQQMVEW